MNKKELIKTVSIKLFNKDGVNNVTTNHIAETCKISPGNLYYHFKNKEEIIKEIYLEMIKEMENTWLSVDINNLYHEFEKILRKLIKHRNFYRFFFLEISSILRNDKSLNEIYLENRRLRLGEMEELFLTLEANNFIQLPKDAYHRKLIYEHLWFISEFSILQEDICSNSDYMLEYMYQLIFNYLTDNGREIFTRISKEI